MMGESDYDESDNYDEDDDDNESRSNQSTPDTQRGSGRRNSKRGFAAMSPEKRRRIARKGGKASHSNSR
ncbi:KGG domain-containing protein [bacterium]|nr:KGG domain-containing protein [bacterium]